MSPTTLTDDERDLVVTALDIVITRLGEDADDLAVHPDDREDWESTLETIEAYEALYRRLTTEPIGDDDLEEDPDAPDDGKMLIAGILYDRETGMEADPQ